MILRVMNACNSLICSISKLLGLFFMWWTYTQTLKGEAVNYSGYCLCNEHTYRLIWSINKLHCAITALAFVSFLVLNVYICKHANTHTIDWFFHINLCECYTRTTNSLVWSSLRLISIKLNRHVLTVAAISGPLPI